MVLEILEIFSLALVNPIVSSQKEDVLPRQDASSIPVSARLVMSMPAPSLEKFAQAIPVCSQTSNLAAVLEVFRSTGCEAIVVVSEQQRPIGLVKLQQILPHLLSSGLLGETTRANSIEDWYKPLSDLKPPILEPLAILPAQLSLSQFWGYLQESKIQKERESLSEEQNSREGGWGNCTTPTQDCQQTFPSGLKPATPTSILPEKGNPKAPDFFNLASTLTLTRTAHELVQGHETKPARKHSSKANTPSAVYPRIASTQLKNPQLPQLIDQQWGLVDEEGKFLGLLNSWLLLKYLAPNFTTTDESTYASVESDELPGLKPLVQLLEQLPLPLSIQTATGQVLAQNLTWRQQIGTSPDLGWVRCTTATMLDSPSVEPRSAPSNNPVPESPGTLPHSNLTVGNAFQQWYKPSTQTSVQRYCAIDTPRLATTVSKSRAVLSAPAECKTQDPSPSWKTSIPASEPCDKCQDRVFSFVKIPLSPSLVKEMEREKQQENKQDITHSAVEPFTADLYVVLAQDTTEQQQVAKELAAKNAELVQLNRLKDEFLACISHELKTPLTAILGLSTLLKDQALGKMNDRQVRYARLIYQSGRQLMTVVNDILDLTRMETGQLELTLGPVQIQTACDRAYAQVRQLQQEKDQAEDSTPETKFTLEIEPGLDMLVADELRLRQMLVHLLSNAIKFTEPDGEIGLRVNCWEGWIAFTVWDTGIGIPAEKQHLIFEKFQQLEQPRTRRFEGTGLGLVLTQRLSRLHGGDVSFISKAGEGSEFTLLLPSCPPQEKGQKSRVEQGLQAGRLNAKSSNLSHLSSRNTCGEQPSTPGNRNYLVLIVETVPRYLESLTQQLNSLGYRVVIARSGPEAIEKARRLQPHAVLLNPLLPQLSGWDVLTLLKSDAQTQHIPVLVTTTQAEKKQAYYNKADGFLSFPVQKQALLESLTGLRENQRPTRSSITILHLNPNLDKKHSDSSVLTTELTDLLNLQHSELNYRVLEADDLEQAELLVRVWRPDVVLLDGAALGDPIAYLKHFSLHSSLASLPLVTLDHQTTEAANQITDLCVYPCLAPDNSSKIAALVQVIEVAAGISRKPSILVMEVSGTQQELELSKVEDQKLHKTVQPKNRHRSSSNSLPVNPHSSWLQALTQYLQTAGYRSLLSSSWEEAYGQIQTQSVDLLLIRIKDISDSAALVKQLIALEKLEKLPPILVLDHRLDTDKISPSAPLELATNQEASPLDKAAKKQKDSRCELESLLVSLATQVLRGSSESMAKLLDQIDWTLSNKGV